MWSLVVGCPLSPVSRPPASLEPTYFPRNCCMQASKQVRTAMGHGDCARASRALEAPATVGAAHSSRAWLIQA